jgi:hypothetical protein
MIRLTDGWSIGCDLFAANATTVHRSKSKGHLRHGQHITVPRGFAVPGWTDEETRQWLYAGSAASGLG